VTSSFTAGQASSSAARVGAAPMTCSKLSSTSSACCSCSALTRRVRIGWVPVSRRKRASAIVGKTKAGSESAVRGIKRTPSGKVALTSAATSSARRVLPTPAIPVRVSRRTSWRASRAQTVCISSSRPKRGVGGMGSRRRAASGSGADRGPRGSSFSQRAAVLNCACSAGESWSACTSRSRVAGCGVWFTPRSRSLIARRLSPARSASASWERPARMRCCRNRVPKGSGSGYGCGWAIESFNLLLHASRAKHASCWWDAGRLIVPDYLISVKQCEEAILCTRCS
jgi:hypothetical protein